MSIRQAPDPVPLREAVAELLELSDERDTWLSRLDIAQRAACQLCYIRGIRVGRGQVLDEEAAFRRAASRMIRDARRVEADERRRWTVRGEQRSRASFGDPHPSDFPGRGAA